MTSAMNCAALDADLKNLASGLEKYMEPAWKILAATMGGDRSSYWQRAKSILPHLPADALHLDPAACRKNIGRTLLKIIRRMRCEQYVELVGRGNVDHTFRMADYVLANSRTLTGEVFREPFKPGRRSPICNDDYIHFVRFFLGLPPLTTIGNLQTRPDHGYVIQGCLQHPGHYLDAAATHASACTAATAARNRKHHSICNILSTFAVEAGLTSQREPASHGLLLGNLPEDQCRRLFPKRTVEGYEEAFQELMYMQRRMMEPNCPIPMEERQAKLQELRDRVPPCHDADVAGLRVDLAVTDPMTGEARWVDVTSVNAASATTEQAECEHLMRYRDQKAFALVASLPKLPETPSPALAQREREKKVKYRRLMMMAELHFMQRRRPTVPGFVAFAVSTSGDLSPGAQNFMNWLCACYHRRCVRGGPRRDGRAPAELTKEYRRRLRVEVQFAIAAGMGEIIRSAGANLASG